MNQSIENRRDFLKRALVTTTAIPFLLGCKNNILAKNSDEKILSLIKKNAVQIDGEWNGAKDAPDNVSWKTNLLKDNDKGEKMIISGTIYQTDGKTPAPNVLIYIYHTDTTGFYGGKNEHLHGHFRGWMLTDETGRYEFQTIKPAPYPNRDIAAHIHPTITTTTIKEDWFDDYLFEGDTLISERERNMAGKKGGFNPIVKLTKNSDGIWHATRNIQLWRA